MIRIPIFITETNVPCCSGLWNFMIVSLFINLVHTYIHTYIYIFSFFQFHTARLLAKYRTRQKHQSYTRTKQLLQVNSTDP